jgi:peptidoglycan/xylan/chitin deacetylase (PgdA/CDA1 family)
MDEDAWKALAEQPEIRLVFWKIPEGKMPGVFAATHRMPFESAALKPDLQKFKEQYERVVKGRDYIYIQGHPNAWKEEEDFEAFKGMVRFLKGQGVRFMTVSEFLESRPR